MSTATLERARETARRLRELRASPLLRPYWQRPETNYGVFEQPFATMPAPRQCLCDCDCGCKASAHKDSATQTWVEEGTQTASFPVPVWEEEPRQAADNLSCSQDSDNDDNDDNVESPDNQDSDKVGMHRSSKPKKDPVSNAAVSPVAPNDRLDPLTPQRTIPHWTTESLHNKSMQLPETSTLTLHQAGHNVTHLRVSPSGSLDIVVRGADTSIGSNSLIVTESPVVKRSQKKLRSQATRRSRSASKRDKTASLTNRRSLDDEIPLSNLDFASISEEDLLQLEVEVLRRHERLRRILER